MRFQQLTFTDIIHHHSHDFDWSENQILKHHLDNLDPQTDDQFIYLWGTNGSGKTHVLQTIASHYAAEKPSIYLPLEMADAIEPNCLDNLEEQKVVCLDDIHFIKQQKAWEEAIFHLYNRIRQTKQTLLVISGDLPPAQIGLQLPDLTSRLQWGLCWHLKEPSDDQKIEILMTAASKKGFELPIAVAQYLLSRSERKLVSLIQVIEQLDVYSIEAQRRIITIPFLKKCLNI